MVNPLGAGTITGQVPRFNVATGNWEAVMPLITDSYYLFKTGSLFYALNGPTQTLGTPDSDAYVVCQAVLDSLSVGNGGGMRLADNTEFTLSNSLLSTGSGYLSNPLNQVIMQGGGWGTILSQANSGKNVITVRDGSTLFLRNLKLQTTGTAGRCFCGDKSGSVGSHPETSWMNGGMDRVFLNGSGGFVSTPVCEIINPMYVYVDDLHVRSAAQNTGSAMIVTNDSTGMSFGNSCFNFVHIDVIDHVSGDPGGLVLQGTIGQTYQLFGMGFNNLWIYMPPTANRTGTAGLAIKNGVNSATFKGTYIENFETTLSLEATSTRAVTSCTFTGGYFGNNMIDGTGLFGIKTTDYVYGNHFNGVNMDVGSGKTAIADGNLRGAGYPNVYQDVPWSGAADRIVTFTYGIFRGDTGVGLLWENQGIYSGSGTGAQTLFQFANLLYPVNSNANPRFVSAELVSDLSATNSRIIRRYADYQNVYVVFDNAPATGSAVMISWKAGV